VTIVLSCLLSTDTLQQSHKTRRSWKILYPSWNLISYAESLRRYVPVAQCYGILIQQRSVEGTDTCRDTDASSSIGYISRAIYHQLSLPVAARSKA
jgi:hypothetical protein